MSSAGELEVSNQLAAHISGLKLEQYTAKSEPAQNSDTDTYIVEPSGELVSIQNVTSEGAILRHASMNSRSFVRKQPFVAGVVDHIGWIKAALKVKEDKGYTNANNIVIVIRGSLPTELPEIISQLAPIETIFAGVYYVSMPSSDSSSGYVVTLKSYWDTPAVF